MPIVPVFPPSGGGGPTPPTPGIPQWLDMPSKVYLINSTPSPDPSEYGWDEPTNGTGPFTYEVTQMGGQTNVSNWTDYDLANRKIISSRTTAPWQSATSQPSVFRIRAYDSAGNYGDCHVLIASPTITSPAAQVVLDEVVLEEDDPAVVFTWPPFAAGYTGSNTASDPWSFALGSGDVWPSLMKNATTARLQGPFTVNPAPGSVIFMNTVQRLGGSGTAGLLIKAFRRKRGPFLTSTGGPYQVVIDHNMEGIGTQVGPKTFSTAGENVEYPWTQAGIGTDYAQFRSVVVTAGTVDVNEVTLDSNGFRGRFGHSVSSSKRHEVVYLPRLLTTYDVPASTNPAFMGQRAAMVHMSDEVVVRFQGQVSRTGTSSSVTWYIGAINDTGVRVVFNQGGAIQGTPATNVAQISVTNGTGTRTIGSTTPSTIYNVPIGVDVYLGTRPRAIIYLWPGDFPDLLEVNPYGTVKNWIAEGNGNNGSYSNSSYSGAADTTFRSSGHAFGYLEYPIIGARLELGNNGAASVDSILKRVVIAHRAGRQIRPMP
jgi:hypothetical protein